MIRKFLIPFLLIVSVFAIPYQHITLDDLDNNHNPKIVVFGDSAESASTSALTVVEKVLDNFGSKLDLKFYFVDRSTGQDEELFNHESFARLPIVFIQGPEESSPSRFEESVTEAALNEYMSGLLSSPDYSSVVKFTTKKDFDNLFLKEKKPILVKHFEEWCGHCKALKPHFARAASKTDAIIFMEVECSHDEESKKFCQNNQVRGYPTLKLFNGKWTEYSGPRTTNGLVQFAEDNTEVVEYDPTEEIRLAEAEAKFVDPVPCDFVDMVIADVEADQEPKFVVFGDIRQTSSQHTYKIIADAAKRLNWSHKIVRVEARRSANADIFQSDFFKDQVRLFVVAPGSTSPTFFDGNVNSEEEIVNFVSDLLVEPDYSLVHEFTTEQDVYNLAKSKGKPVVMKHFEQWCGHCKALKPHFARAAEKSQNVIFMEVECSKTEESKKFCEKQDIKGYPTLKVWDGAHWKEFNAPRSASGLADAAASLHYVNTAKTESKTESSSKTESKSFMDTAREQSINFKNMLVAKSIAAKKLTMQKYQTSKKLVMSKLSKDL